ncbi:MAG TPA: hypothetical protein VFC84_06030 [Desulfosporosinus sp.]|nr:hypothetical protein [Desulfosporosinus sp.]
MKIYLSVLILIIVTGILALVDLPTLFKNKEYKQLFIVVSLFSIGFILNFLLIIGVKLPNPNKFIVFVMEVLVPK